MKSQAARSARIFDKAYAPGEPENGVSSVALGKSFSVDRRNLSLLPLMIQVLTCKSMIQGGN